MKYGFNIEVNYKSNLLNFYEWEEEDNIILLNKTPIVKVDNQLYNNLLNKNVKINPDYLKEITLDKDLSVIFTSDYDAIIICFYSDGKVNKLSKMSLEDEADILELMYKSKESNFEYKIINKNKNPYDMQTRMEKQTCDLVNKELEKIKDNEQLIDYLCFELFDNVPKENKYERLVKEISQDQNKYQERFYKIIKLLNNV